MIYFLYSSDKDIVSRYIDDLVCKNNINKESLIYYNVSVDGIDKIILECNTYSLFSKTKMIIVDIDGIFNNSVDDSEILKYLDNYNKDVILVCVSFCDKVDTRRKIYKKLNSVGIIKALVKDNNYLVNLVKDKLDDYKMNDINYFLSRVGNNVNDILNELEKIINYKNEDKVITRSDIDSVVLENIEEEIFAFTDAIIKNDVKKAIKLYYYFKLKNYDETQMISLIASSFRFLLQVKLLYKKNMNNDEIANTLKVHPYRVKVSINNLYYYDEEMLKDYLVRLTNLDYEIKLGLIDKSIFFQLFVIKKDM